MKTLNGSDRKFFEQSQAEIINEALVTSPAQLFGLRMADVVNYPNLRNWWKRSLSSNRDSFVFVLSAVLF